MRQQTEPTRTIVNASQTATSAVAVRWVTTPLYLESVTQ